MTQRYSHSMLSMYRTCPLKFKLHYVDRLVPLQPGSRHDLDFGAAWHEAMKVHYLAGGNNVEGAQEAFAMTYPAGSYPYPLPMWSQGKSYRNGLTAISAYADRWREDDQYWKVLHVEERSDPEDDERILKLDLIVQDVRDDQIYGVDHKATGKYLDNHYWLSFDPDSQVRFYTDYIVKRFSHCGGFYINAASFKHRSKAVTPRSGPDKGVQQPAGDWFNFARMLYNPNAQALQLERDNFSYWTRRIAADKESGNWGYNDRECYRSGIECEYLKICSPGYQWPEDRELLLSYYRQQCPRVLPEGRCQLDLDHDGNHDPTLPTQVDFDVATDEAEEAIN